MKLMMYIGNDLIDSSTLEEERVPIPGYLGEFKRQMKLRHRELILQSEKNPEFIVTITDVKLIKSENTSC